MKKILTTLIVIALLTTQTIAFSKNKIIDFKQKKGLKSDEGLVVLILDINFRIAKISVGKVGNVFPVYSMKKPKTGTQMKIIKLKAGKYYWKEGIGRSGNTTYNFEIDKRKTSFEVKAGKLNYPGTLEFKGWLNSNDDVVFNYNMLNNSTVLLVELKKNFQSLLDKYPLVYSGENPDPFLEYNRNLDQNKSQ